MEPDYENMPEGTTHFGKVNDFFTPWYKYDEVLNKWYYAFNGDTEKFSHWVACPGNIPYHIPVRSITPSEESPKGEEKEAGVPAWIPGSDLPPIGEIVELSMDFTECQQFNHGVKAGTRVEIIAHMKVYNDDVKPKVAVFRYKIDERFGSHSVRQAIAACFRKARTDEEIAEEKMNDELAALQGELSIDGSATEIGLLQQLYKAGKLKL